MSPRFVDTPLRLVIPRFDSPLTDVVIELDHVRRLRLTGDTPPAVFLQLKEIFHTLESLGSARIEGSSIPRENRAMPRQANTVAMPSSAITQP